MKKTNENGWVRAFNAQRRTWKPGMGVTKVIPDKRHDPPKYEPDLDEEDDIDYEWEPDREEDIDYDWEPDWDDDWELEPEDELPFV